MEIRIAEDVRTPRLAFASITAESAIHGVTDGSWSLIDAIRELLRLSGPGHIDLATWTAAAADLREAERLLRARNLKSFRLIVDRSFQSRQPRYCALARELFGDAAVRVWNSHAKFCIVRGGIDFLYLTSANLNRNRRIETFSLYAASHLCGQYLGLIGRLFEMQRPGEGFEHPERARKHTEELLR